MSMRTHQTTAALGALAAGAFGIVALTGCSTTPDVSLPSQSDQQVTQSDQAVAEPAADTQEETTPAATEQRTRENPFPIGSQITDGDWTVAVNSVSLDASEAVAAANEFNDPAPDGSVYLMVNLTATYNGDDPQGGHPFVTVEYVTAGGNTINSYDTFVVAPDEFQNLDTLYNGASLSGNVVLTVPADGADQGVLAISPDMLSDKVFVAVK